MKKWILMSVLAMMLTAALTGCGAKSAQEATGQTETEGTAVVESSAVTESSEAKTDEATEEASETENGEKKTLVVYYSWSGNTEKIANMIGEYTGGTLFKLEPAEPYSEDYNTVVEQAKKEQQENARPALAADVEDFDSYDVIFMGYPNWWSDVPMLMNTFMESHDFTGKTVIPFCTHGGGGFGKSVSSVKAGTAGATVLDGLAVSGSQADGAQTDVLALIDSLGFRY